MLPGHRGLQLRKFLPMPKLTRVPQTLEMEVQILDKDVLQKIVKVNDSLREQGKPATQGVRLKLLDENEKQLFFGDVHPNIQYEYEATNAGVYKMCVQLTKMSFNEGYASKIKTKVKFSAEFHRSKSNVIPSYSMKMV